MDSVDIQVLRAADTWVREGRAAFLGTVVRTWGSAPRPSGSLIVLRRDGRVVGSVSGGCIEDDLIERAQDERLSIGRPLRLLYGADADEAERFELPCGGALELVVEPLSERSLIGPLLERLSSGRLTRRILDMTTGEVLLDDHEQPDQVVSDGNLVTNVYGRRWRLLLIGAGQLAHYVAQLAVACEYEVMVCDPRAEYAETWSVKGTSLLTTMPDDAVLAIRPDARTAVIALTHDPKLDDLALIEALKTPAFYVGALGSRRHQDRRKQRLKEFGLSEAFVSRLHGPVGVKNGARSAPEIAASILTELTATKYGFRIAEPKPIVGVAHDE